MVETIIKIIVDMIVDMLELILEIKKKRKTAKKRKITCFLVHFPNGKNELGAPGQVFLSYL